MRQPDFVSRVRNSLLEQFAQNYEFDTNWMLEPELVACSRSLSGSQNLIGAGDAPVIGASS